MVCISGELSFLYFFKYGLYQWSNKDLKGWKNSTLQRKYNFFLSKNWMVTWDAWAKKKNSRKSRLHRWKIHWYTVRRVHLKSPNASEFGMICTGINCGHYLSTFLPLSTETNFLPRGPPTQRDDPKLRWSWRLCYVCFQTWYHVTLHM